MSTADAIDQEILWLISRYGINKPAVDVDGYRCRVVENTEEDIRRGHSKYAIIYE